MRHYSGIHMADSHEPFVIGVDGGGSRCRFALATTAGRVIARHEEGAANIASDFEAAAATIGRGLQSVCVAAGIGDTARLAVHMGLAGANLPGAADRLKRQLGLADLTIEDDRRTAVTAALGGGLGAVASCGTGSFICRQTADQLLSIGGWGLALGDDASGAWLGQSAMRRAVLAQDGLVPMTGLLSEVAAKTGGTRPEMVAFSLIARPRDYAALAPLVVSAAAAGDPEGRRLMQLGADYIREALTALGHPADAPLCLLGGVGPHYAALLSEFRQQPPLLPAVSGALILAARAARIATEGKPWT